MKRILLVSAMLVGCQTVHEQVETIAETTEEEPEHPSECPSAQMKGFDPPFTRMDTSVLARAKYVCRSRYGKCLKYLTKTAPNAYRAICGNP